MTLNKNNFVKGSVWRPLYLSAEKTSCEIKNVKENFKVLPWVWAGGQILTAASERNSKK